MVYPRDVPQLEYCYSVQPRFQKLGGPQANERYRAGIGLINMSDSMRTEQRVNWSFVGFFVAGLASAFVTLWIRRNPLGWANLFGSLWFGIFLSICFWVFHGLRSVWKTTVFVLVSIAAASLAGGTAILLNGSLGYDRTHLREIIVGGYVGAFVILFGAMMLLFPKMGLWRSIVKSVLWASAGGVFAGDRYSCELLVSRCPHAARPRPARFRHIARFGLAGRHGALFWHSSLDQKKHLGIDTV